MNDETPNYLPKSQQLTMFEREAPYSPPKPIAKEAPTPKSAIPKPDTNANREGYKLTKLGWIPEEWNVERLVNVATIQTGIQKGTKEEGEKVKMPYLRVANVQDGHLDLSEVKHIEVPVGKISRYLLRKDDVLMTEGGDFDKLGRGTIWSNEVNKCLHQNHVFVVRVSRGRLSPYFLNAFASSEKGKKYFISCSKQSTNLASINSTQLKNLPVPIPPLPEQRAIADCLSTWDQAIQTLTQLIAQKELRKKWLMQQLLTGKRRLPGFGDEWKEITLDEISERITQKNEELNDNVVTISAQRGFVRQEDFFNKRVASDTLVGYYLVHRGEFAYNKSYSNGYPMGAFKRLDDFDKAVVTTLYICFKLKPSTDSDFAKYFFDGGRMNQNLMRIAQEGGRAHGLLNIGLSDFFGLKLVIPTKEEQTAIAQILQRADQEISLLNQKLIHLQNQKKGLMQQLLTGNKRLNLNNK